MRELAGNLGRTLVRERAGLFDVEGRVERSLQEHQRIFRAVQDSDSHEARTAVLNHLDSLERDLDFLLSQQDDTH